MSRIFTWRELNEKLIPNPEDFEAVKARARKLLIDAPGVYGAVLFGSVLTGQSGPTSDMDIMVLFLDESAEKRLATQSVCQAITFFSRENNVPLNFVPAELGPPNEAGLPMPTKRHSIQAGLFNHLQAAALHGGVVKQNPIQLLDVPNNKGVMMRESREYVARCYDKLFKSVLALRALTEEERCVAYSQALDKPFHAVRRALETRMDALHVADIVTKSDLMSEAEHTFGTSVTAPLASIRRRAQEYQEIAERARDLVISKSTHETFLATLPSALEDALTVLQALRRQL